MPDINSPLLPVKNQLEAQEALASHSPSLHNAVIQQNIELVKQLVSVCNNINEFDKNGYTPLHIAAQIGNATIVKILLNNGANSALKDTNDDNLYHDYPIYLSISNGHLNVTKLLLQNETNAVLSTGKIKDGFYLKLAIWHARAEHVEFFLKNGNSITVKKALELLTLSKIQNKKEPLNHTVFDQDDLNQTAKVLFTKYLLKLKTYVDETTQKPEFKKGHRPKSEKLKQAQALYDIIKTNSSVTDFSIFPKGTVRDIAQKYSDRKMQLSRILSF